MTREESISTWISQLRSGDVDALHKLWDKYAPKVKEIASARLCGTECRVADDDDVLVSVFDRVWRTAERGMIDSINDKEGFEAFLVAVTIGKVIDLRRHHSRKRRGSGAVRGDSIFGIDSLSSRRQGFEQIPDNQPTPGELSEMVEQSRFLLETLGSDELTGIAVAKLEGRSNAEIADRLDCSVATVERRLRLIRKKWEAVVDDA